MGPASSEVVDDTPLAHPRRITWIGASALALGGSNQSIFIISGTAGLFAVQGSAAVPLMLVGLMLAFMAAPGWIELSCMFPNRVGGIAATCAEAFRPYSAVLANLTGVCYWWGWVPTCGLTAIFSADALHQWYLPTVSVTRLAILIVLVFMALNLCGLKWATRLAVPLATAAALLALGSTLIPIATGHVDWHRAVSFHLASPFHGTFGRLTSAMAGLYLIGFAAPAFEAAACHIGEMKNPRRDQPRAMWTAGGLASIYFVFMPLVWLGVFGPHALSGNLAALVGPTFQPLVGSLAKSVAIWFIALNMFCGTIQPLSGASRTLSQLAEDGLLPRIMAKRIKRTDAPIVAIMFTAAAAIAGILFGDPLALIAAANLTYLIGISLPSIAVAILRRNEPNRVRIYRAHDWSIRLGVAAAIAWLLATVLGFEQFGLPYVIFGLVLAYSGSIAYSWGVRQQRKREGTISPRWSLHFKLTGAMLAVLSLDGAGYLIAVNHVGQSDPALIALLKDLFVAVGLLTITVGLVLPGMIAHTAEQVSRAAQRLSRGTLHELSNAMEALAAGDLEHAQASVQSAPVDVRTRDEFGLMAESFNVMQAEAGRVAAALDVAALQLRRHRDDLENLVKERTAELTNAYDGLRAERSERQALLQRIRALSGRLYVSYDEHVDEVAAISQVSKAIASVMGLNTVLIQLVDGDGEIRQDASLWRSGSLQRDVEHVSLPEPVRRFLLTDGERHETVAVNDVTQRSSVVSDNVLRDLVALVPIRSFFLCPFYGAEGTLLGFLFVAHSRNQLEWSDDDATIIETVAGDLARAVVNARLFDEHEHIVAQLRELDRTKSEMISTFSHELRTPLASIRAYVELMRAGETELLGGTPRMLEVIEKNTLRLSRLIEDILTVSHLESEVYGSPLMPLELGPLVTSVTTALRAQATDADLELNVYLPDEMIQVLGDEQQLERVLFNLLTNAIKFTHPGGTIEVAITTSPGEVLIVVRDNGMGIPEDELTLVLDRFYRGSNATDQVIAGTGLGLSIVDAIVRHHGGTMEITSSVGRGTTIYIHLPSSLPRGAGVATVGAS